MELLVKGKMAVMRWRHSTYVRAERFWKAVRVMDADVQYGCNTHGQSNLLALLFCLGQAKEHLGPHE
jgi:hypothetical protein